MDSPSVLSVECPAVGLGRAGWYRGNPRRMPHMRLGVVAAVLDSQDRVLLTRRAAHMRSFPASWVLPGGGLDPGEDLVDGIMREASTRPSTTTGRSHEGQLNDLGELARRYM